MTSHSGGKKQHHLKKPTVNRDTGFSPKSLDSQAFGIRSLHETWLFQKASIKRNYLEPEASTLKWLFQLDDSQSLHKKWLFHHFHPLKNWLFRVPR